MSLPVAPIHPPQRSFKPRRRSLSPTRQVLYERSMQRWSLAVVGPDLAFQEIFRSVDDPSIPDVVLDIGFGGGEALIELAEVRPTEQVIGVDVHTPGVAAVLEAIEARGLRNVRVVEGDAIEFIDRIPLQSIAAIRAFFPDPWPKRRQLNRRLIRPAVVERFVQLLRLGGSLHLATDSADYAEQMGEVCDAVPSLRGGVIARPSWRPMTRFEQRGLDEGRQSVDLLYVASESSLSEASSAFR